MIRAELLIIILLFSTLTAMYIYSYNSTYHKNTIIKKLIRQSARWANASVQDDNVLIKNLHANYGAAYLWSTRDIFTDNEISKATGINVIDFQQRIVSAQDSAMRKLKDTCSDSLHGLDPILTEVSSRQI